MTSTALLVAPPSFSMRGVGSKSSPVQGPAKPRYSAPLPLSSSASASAARVVLSGLQPVLAERGDLSGWVGSFLFMTT